VSVQSIPANSPGQGGTDRVAPRSGVRPYGAVLHELNEDPNLNGTAVQVACALMKYARSKASCYPSVAKLAADLGKAVRTIQYALKRLIRAGWISVAPSDGNKTGREIVLTWKVARRAVLGPYSQGLPRPQKVAPPPVQEMSPKGVQAVAPELSKKEREEKGSALALGDGKKTARPQPDPMTPEELERGFREIGCLSYPPGHPMRRFAERSLLEAIASSGRAAGPGSAQPGRFPLGSPPGSPSIAAAH
jgi:hypothetical protein